MLFSVLLCCFTLYVCVAKMLIKYTDYETYSKSKDRNQ
jgi:hypothetical protein